MELFKGKTKVGPFLLFGLLIIEFSSRTVVFAADEIRVENVRYEVEPSRIIVYYDLLGAKDEEYTVALSLRRKSVRLFHYVPKQTTGDVGEGRFAGKGRQIIWDSRAEVPSGLEGEDYYFVVEAEVISRGLSPFVWAAGAAVLGGAAALLLLSKDDEETVPVVESGFPRAPGRP